MDWLRIFKHLLPRGRAWSLTASKNLRQFFDGLSVSGSDAKAFLDGAYNDLDPQLTSSIPEWETQFALPAASLTEQQRRDRLAAAWKALGGQDPGYLQSTLQAAGFDVYVHEWWEPIAGRPAGGSIDGDVIPTARDPFNYLDDGTGGLPFLMVDGGSDAQDGGATAYDGASATPAGYPLVNKILTSTDLFIGDGAAAMQDGAQNAQDGGVVTVYDLKQYAMPADPTKYPFFLYIGGAAFPDQATVPTARRDEFEELCLKLCPNEQWLGILVNYT